MLGDFNDISKGTLKMSPDYQSSTLPGLATLEGLLLRSSFANQRVNLERSANQ